MANVISINVDVSPVYLGNVREIYEKCLNVANLNPIKYYGKMLADFKRLSLNDKIGLLSAIRYGISVAMKGGHYSYTYRYEREDVEKLDEIILSLRKIQDLLDGFKV